MERQFRFDSGEVQRARITEDGFLKAVCVMTRTGVFTYVNQDGSLRRELRLPEEVFKAASMDTLKMIPLTNEHPPGKIVNADNSKQLSVGNTGESVSVNAPFLMNSILVTDQNTVEDVQSGRKVQLSCGYSLDLEEKPGEYMGERYDVIQRNIVYNHVAILARGKAGREARIALDAHEAIQIDSDEGNDVLVSFTEETTGAKIWEDEGEFKGEPHSHKYKVNNIGNGETAAAGNPSHIHKIFAFTASWADGHYHELKNVPKVRNDSKQTKHNNKENNPMLPKINLDGINYEASQEVINAFGKQKTRADAAEASVENLKKEKTELQANCDAKDAEIKKLESAASDESAVQKRVDERIALVTLAQTHLDKSETPVAEMSDNEIQTAIIAKATPMVNVDSEDFKNDVYRKAFFDAAVSMLTKAENNDNEENNNESSSGIGEQRRKANADKFEKGKKPQNADAAEEGYKNGLSERWKRDK